MSDDRPEWRMTFCENQTLNDLDSFARKLGNEERWVPEKLITLIVSARKGGNPMRTLVNLRNKGFVESSRSTSRCWRRTNKPAPKRLIGETPNLIANDAIERVVRAWESGRRNLTFDDLIPPHTVRADDRDTLSGRGRRRITG
jgi:hypothetical protein